jgi:hypothetical protein
LISEEDDFIEEGIVVVAPVRSRRVVAEPGSRGSELSREAEFTYIRSDMRKLFVIAAGLLALMLVLLVVVSP